MIRPHSPLALLLVGAAYAQAPAEGQAEPPAPAPQTRGAATLTKPPTLVKFAEAVYPPEALAAGLEADVVLAIDVDATGRVTRVEIAQPAGRGFDEAAAAAARAFEFTPAEADGKPVPVRITYKYRFTIKRETAPPPAAVNFRGVVKERGTRAVLPGMPVAVEGVGRAETDAQGRFEMVVPPPPREIAVRIEAPEYHPFETRETIAQGKLTEVVYWVERRSYDPYETVVRARRPRKEVAQQTLEVQEVARIPGTQGDTLKVVQNLPGVARPAFGGGEIVVWGSSPQDTGIFLEGVRIPRLYHFGGLRSVVASSIVQSIDFVPGAYGARYGRGMGGIVEVATRAPKTDRFHGEVGVDLIDAQVLVEGPVGGSTSALVAARRSYIDAIIANVVPEDEVQFRTAPRYWDYQAMARHEIGGRQSLTFLAFGSDDVLALLADDPDPAVRAQIEFHDYFHKAMALWRRSAGATRLAATASLGYQSTGVDAGFDRTAGVRFDFVTVPGSARFELSRPLAGPFEIRAGLDVEGVHGDVSVFAPGGPPREDEGGGQPEPQAPISDAATFDQIAIGPYAEFPLALGRWRIVPGLRVDVYYASAYRGTPDAASRLDPVVEPRVSARYQMTERVALKGAAGLYHQPPEPADLSRSFGNPDVGVPYDIQYTAGVDVQVRPKVRLETEAFYKDFRNLIVGTDDPTGPLVENDGVGRAYGAEAIVRHDPDGKFFGWIAYTLMRAERRDHPGEDFRPFDFDQTHILTLVASRKLGRSWEVGLRFRLTSGSTYTPVAGSYLDAQSGEHRPIYSDDENGARLPLFHQLDLRVEKTWIYQWWMLTAYLEILNTYNHANPEMIVYNFDYTESQYVSGLPILPVFGARGQF